MKTNLHLKYSVISLPMTLLFLYLISFLLINDLKKIYYSMIPIIIYNINPISVKRVMTISNAVLTSLKADWLIEIKSVYIRLF